MSAGRRRGLGLAGAVLCAVAALSACDSPTTLGENRAAVVDSTEVSSQGVSPAPGRTYEYGTAPVRPDSVLLALWYEGVNVQVAWWPLAYRCEDPFGPRLTVQLAAPDARMADHGFTLGTGRLGCSEQLIQYTIMRIGGV